MTVPKLSDIAIRTGLNVSTISRALREAPDISRDTIRYVQMVAQEVGYRYRKLDQLNARSIGVILPEVRSHYYAEIAHAITKEIGKHGYSALLMLSGFDTERIMAAFEEMLKQDIVGVILSGIPGVDEQRPQLGGVGVGEQRRGEVAAQSRADHQRIEQPLRRAREGQTRPVHELGRVDARRPPRLGGFSPVGDDPKVIREKIIQRVVSKQFEIRGREFDGPFGKPHGFLKNFVSGPVVDFHYLKVIREINLYHIEKIIGIVRLKRQGPVHVLKAFRIFPDMQPVHAQIVVGPGMLSIQCYGALPVAGCLIRLTQVIQ